MKGTLKAKAIRLTAAIAAGATLMSVAACGAQPGGGSAKATGANATVWTLTDSTWASVQQTFEDWNKANPDAQIKNESFAYAGAELGWFAGHRLLVQREHR